MLIYAGKHFMHITLCEKNFLNCILLKNGLTIAYRKGKNFRIQKIENSQNTVIYTKNGQVTEYRKQTTS